MARAALPLTRNPKSVKDTSPGRRQRGNRLFPAIRMNKQYTAIDLFSGCGGLTLGLKLAGFKVLAAIENDALAVETYATNHPEVLVCHNDIRKVKAASLRKRLKLDVGDLDLLA